MGLPAGPPKYASWAELVSSIRQGETGWRAYALQVALTSLGKALTADGDFGPATATALKSWQASNGLVADAIAGPATQGLMLKILGSKTHDRLPDVPEGLMRGFAEGEGANVLGATNWSVPGGVDCGAMQYRILGPPYDQAALRRAFDALASMVAAGRVFLERAETFSAGAWVRAAVGAARREELAKRIAILAHNWPAGARDFAANGTCSNPNGIATWVSSGTRFPDGTPVRTRYEWCLFYAMGGPHGEGAITKYVTDWS